MSVPAAGSALEFSMPELTPGDWTLDPKSSSIAFSASLLPGVKVKSSFSRWQARIVVGASPSESSVAVTVWTESLATGLKLRDNHLRSSTAFSSEQHPTMEFHSTVIAETSDGIDVEGTLRIRDTARTVNFRAVRNDTPGAPRYTAELQQSGGDFGFTRMGTKGTVDIIIDAVLVPA